MTTVILLGASTRAAATSVVRAGWKPWCADLFADRDLERIATVRKIPADQYPDGLLDALQEAPPGPVMYTGALENRPDLIAKIDRPLWGVPSYELETIRSPQECEFRLVKEGIRCPAISFDPVTTGRWLIKPIQSGGGLGVRRYRGQPFDPRTHYLQEWLDGEACSAVFMGFGFNALPLGVSQSLVRIPWLNAAGFRYAGSIVRPMDKSPMTMGWILLGAAAARAFGLRGLFGIDAILRDDVPWPIEINPRYTASVEVIERFMRVPLLALHRGLFEKWDRDRFAAKPGLQWGKAVLYARRTFEFPRDGPWLASLEDSVDLDTADYADIPHAGEVIERGQPVLTIFASGATTDECRAALQEKAQALDRRLWG